MSEALQQAYASMANEPVHTIRILHSALTGTKRCFVRGKHALTVPLENDEVETFMPVGMALSVPQRGVSGRQDLNFELSNISLEASHEIDKVVKANRAKLLAGEEAEVVWLEYRTYLEGDLNGPHGPVYRFTVNSTSPDVLRMTLQASFMAISDTVFPRQRYYTNEYPGVRYA